jgi:hypothetical protein
MNERLGSRRRRAAVALVHLLAAIAWAGGLDGCVGSGDDRFVPAGPADGGGDARPSDGASDSLTDGPRDGAVAEGGSPDVTQDTTVAQDSGGPMDATVQDRTEAASPGVDAGHSNVVFSSTSIDFGPVSCGATAQQILTIVNNGSAPLVISAMAIGSGFGVNKSSLVVNTTGTLTVTATVPSSATAGAALSGSLNLFTNDPKTPSVFIKLTATPSGAMLSLVPGSSVSTSPPGIAFPTTTVNTTAPQVTFIVQNKGNAPATFSLGSPSDPQFSLSALPAGGVTLNGGDLWTETAGFVPTTGSMSGAPKSATSTVTVTGVSCGAASLSSIALSGISTTALIDGWPHDDANNPNAVVKAFGAAYCGGAAPTPASLTITNHGTVDAHITSVTGPDAGFTTDVVANTTGSVIPAQGSLTIHLTAPAIPAPTPTSSPIDLKQIDDSVTFHVDVDGTDHSVALQEQPTGAILAFDTQATSCQGPPAAPGSSFGKSMSASLIGSPPTQTFCVVNSGNGPPTTVNLIASVTGAGADAASSQPFQLQAGSLTVSPAQQPEATDTLKFAPVMVGPVQGQLAMSVVPPDPDAGTGYLCALLPSIPLSGTGTGSGLSVNSGGSLQFHADCNGAVPAAQTFTVSNANIPTADGGPLDVTWSIGSVTGAGAAQYMVSAAPPPGVLHAGQSSTVTVTAARVPSSVTDPNALAAQFTISTDVTGDSHVITLSEIPTGDQIAVSPSSLGFGQIPIGSTSPTQVLTITNNGNPGSADANITLTPSGAGAAAYGVSALALIPAGQSRQVNVTFAPTAAMGYPATIALSSSDTQCTSPLPSVQLQGTGTSGHFSMSKNLLTFGDNGFVDCGATSGPLSFTVSNTLASVGNQAFTFTFPQPSSGRYGVSLNGNPPQAGTTSGTLQPGDTAIISVQPTAIPPNVDSATLNSATPAYQDVLTINTNIPSDAGHPVQLVMKPRGTIITGTPPLTTPWNFQTVALGQTSTITSALENTGNDSALVSLGGVAQPAIFHLAGDPTAVAPDNTIGPDGGVLGATSIIAQFVPPSAHGQWSDQGMLVITAAHAFCVDSPPAPWQKGASATQWQTPIIPMTGSSN